MKLFVSDPSPFVRKVRVVIEECGLVDRVELVAAKLSPIAPDARVTSHNPLGKIPALVLDDGTTLVDSSVICAYLDTLHVGTKLVGLADADARFRALRLEAIADGVLDAGILIRYERLLRPRELQWDAWADGQAAKVKQSLAALEHELDAFAERVDIGSISVACAIGWLAFREPVPELRSTFPRLHAWVDRFSERPSMRATIPHD